MWSYILFTISASLLQLLILRNKVDHIYVIIEGVYYKSTLSAHSHNESVALFNWCSISI